MVFPRQLHESLPAGGKVPDRTESRHFHCDQDQESLLAQSRGNIAPLGEEFLEMVASGKIAICRKD
jgi:hypothetical protein